MTRNELLARYQRLRQITKDHHNAAHDYVSRQAILRHARNLGMMVDGCLVYENDAEMNLVSDLALYTAKPGRSSGLDRYARATPLPQHSDERLVLDAMRASCFSIWRIDRRHEIAGLVLCDMFRQTEAWIVDVAMEATAPEGMCFAGRLYRPEQFWITSGAFAPVDALVIEELEDGDFGWCGGDPDRLVKDQRFATEVYRIAIGWGKLDSVQYLDPEETTALVAAA